MPATIATYPDFLDQVRQLVQQHRALKQEPLRLAVYYAPQRRRGSRDIFVFACPDWCNVVAVTPEAEIVCIWQYRFGTQALELEVPGGVLEANEAPAGTHRPTSWIPT